MKKVIKLTESDLARIVKRVLKEQQAAAPAQGTNQTQGATPGRRYQIADFVSPTFAVGTKISFDIFNSKNYRDFMRMVGVDAQQFWANYDTNVDQILLAKGDKRANLKAKSELCRAMDETVVMPSIKQDATPDAKSFLHPPVKIVCDGYFKGVSGDKISQVVVKQINNSDAQKIAGQQTGKKYTTDAPYLIAQS